MQITKTFAVDGDKDLVRPVLDKYYHPITNGGGPSWLTFSGHTKDSLSGEKSLAVANGEPHNRRMNIGEYSWQQYCNGLFQLRVAA